MKHFNKFLTKLRILSTDFLALRLFCFNIRQRGRQTYTPARSYFKLHVDGRKFHNRRPHTVGRPQVVYRCYKESRYKTLKTSYLNIPHIKIITTFRATQNPFHVEMFVKPSKLKYFPEHLICCRNNILLSITAALKACAVSYFMHCELWTTANCDAIIE